MSLFSLYKMCILLISWMSLNMGAIKGEMRSLYSRVNTQKFLSSVSLLFFV